MDIGADFKLTRENRDLLIARDKFRTELRLKPELYLPWFPFCRVRTLIVTDGGLDFSDDDFGLATFVRSLLDSNVPGRFDVTLGHLDNRSGAAMMDFDTRIKNRIPNLKFDDSDHFARNKYDVVFLFGIRSSMFGRGAGYPSASLSDAELQELTEFQNSGGGLFATGDHAALGKFMGDKLARASKMRLWDSTSPNNNLDEVSMGGPRRNDTNRLGDPGSQFDDQSDDIPQSVVPKIYSIQNWLFKYSFPHPLLCGPNGVIRVMPDHPHEGECVEPTDTNDILNFTAALGPEFPPAINGGPRPLPEVISTNRVLSGTTSGGKQPTVGHTFGGICAYDGHRAGIGRVVTDATWHHFVNINLVGDADYSDATIKGNGFLASAAGQVHLGNIRAYYRNIAVWLARPGNIRCMNSGWLLLMYKKGRVMEAVLTRTDIKFEKLKLHNFWEIGYHARDVLGKYASRCQSRRLILDLIWPEFNPNLPAIDPWDVPNPKLRDDLGDGINWINGDHALDAALGAAIAAVHSEIGDKFEDKYDDEAVMKVAQQGARRGLEIALKSLGSTLEAFQKQIK